MKLRLTIAASVLAVLVLASSATGSPPHTSQLLFHPSNADLHAIARSLVRSIERIKLGGHTHLDVTASCRKTSPAINTKRLGYRHILCAIHGPGPLAVHGRVVLSIRNQKPVYRGTVCALGICKNIHGTVT